MTIRSFASFTQKLGHHSTDLYLDKASNSLNRQVTARVGNLVTGFWTVPAVAIDTCLAVPTLVSILGFNQELYSGSKQLLNSFQMILSWSYRSLLTTVNPNAFHGTRMHTELDGKPSEVRQDSKLEGSGLVAEKVKAFFKSHALQFAHANGKGLFKACQRQLASRIMYAVTYTASAVFRIVDLAIAVFAMTAGVVLTLADLVGLGRFEWLQTLRTETNSIAFRSLQIGGIVRDLFKGIAKTFNPWIGERKMTQIEGIKHHAIPHQERI
jgi:hypothetical protein